MDAVIFIGIGLALGGLGLLFLPNLSRYLDSRNAPQPDPEEAAIIQNAADFLNTWTEQTPVQPAEDDVERLTRSQQLKQQVRNRESEFRARIAKEQALRTNGD